MKPYLHKTTIAVAVSALGWLTSALSTPAQEAQFSTPDWFVLLSDHGYSDYLIYTSGEFPAGSLHEMLSGELGAAIAYDGIEDQLVPPQRAMWLEPEWVYPTWTTNSNFVIDAGWNDPPGPPSDRDGDGMLEGQSVMSNLDVRITLDVDPEDTLNGTPMGMRLPQPVSSNRYVMFLKYEIENISGHSLTNLRFFQFLHAHPANSEIGNVQAVYDPASYAGIRSDYHYDVTQTAVGSGAKDGAFTGCQFRDHVNISGNVIPADFGLGHYREHFGRPESGLHDEVERDVLENQVTFGPDQVAGAMRWDLGTLANGQKASLRVMVAVRSEELPGSGQLTNSSCVRITSTGGDPSIRVERGACGAASAAPPYDVITGFLAEVINFPGSQTLMTGAVCEANDLAQDRVTLTNALSLCRDSLYILVRQGNGLQSNYGVGSDGTSRDAPSGCP